MSFSFIINHGCSYWCKELLLLLNIVSQGGMNCEYELYTHTRIMPGNTQETLQDTWKTIGTLQVVSFLVFLPENVSWVCFMHPYAPCDIITAKTMPPSGRAHPQLHCVKFWSKLDWRFPSYSHFCTIPLSLNFPHSDHYHHLTTWDMASV